MFLHISVQIVKSTSDVLAQIHLKVDTTLANKKFSINAYQFRMLALGEKVLATEFIEIPCDVLFQDVERAGGMGLPAYVCCVCLRTCLCVCVCMCVCMPTCVHAHMCFFLCVCVCVSVLVCPCVSVCMSVALRMHETLGCCQLGCGCNSVSPDAPKVASATPACAAAAVQWS